MRLSTLYVFSPLGVCRARVPFNGTTLNPLVGRLVTELGDRAEVRDRLAPNRVLWIEGAEGDGCASADADYFLYRLSRARPHPPRPPAGASALDAVAA